MGKNLRFCYKIDEAVGLAIDEEGNSAAAYACLKAKDVKDYKISDENFQNLQDGFLKVLISQLGCDSAYVTSITLDEYLDKIEE